MPQTRTLILTGQAGSGRSTMLRVLEDLGYFCIDNFVPALVPAFLQQPAVHPLLALEMDARSCPPEPHGVVFAAQLEQAIQHFKEAGHNPLLVFVAASPEAILGRYALTRRPHPLIEYCGSLSEAIALDADALALVRDRAQVVFDTSVWGIKDLRKQVEDLVAGHVPPMVVTLTSFGYKYSLPPDANLCFDIRFLPNPFYEPALRPRTGMDVEVVDYVFSSKDAQTTFEHIHRTVGFFLEHYRQERRGQVNLAIGCTGGQHRSVAFVERLAQILSTPGNAEWQVRVRHREQERKIYGFPT
ncbi:RNase adapter RapZ [Anthocerotibacter panamensis]|uniref:RNase adapter RapZ n=1 Tax=Anthocerotibacter panamensis TaxID=2857077 RepID=UPI001C4071DF|nr:RNase adapter RapZ [Anthocerotibacter panamensis]